MTCQTCNADVLILFAGKCDKCRMMTPAVSTPPAVKKAAKKPKRAKQRKVASAGSYAVCNVCKATVHVRVSGDLRMHRSRRIGEKWCKGKRGKIVMGEAL